MFGSLSTLREDPILGLMARFRADADPRKVDLGVGVYRDPAGNTPVLDCVRRAEAALIGAQTSKAYVAPAGRAEFNTAVTSLVLGGAHPAVSGGRTTTVQTPGGCGALRVGAELVRSATPQARVWVSDPTWGNHMPLLGSSGLALARYPYYDAATRELQLDAMLSTLEGATAGDVVLLHACCHNPSGADLSEAGWDAVIQLLQRRGLIPFLDLAYQGFGAGLDADAAAARRVLASVPEALLAISFSKNLGLYRERVGALLCVAADPAETAAARSHMLQIGRGIYSMPPDHGAAIAAAVLTDSGLRAQWQGELDAMRGRIMSMRDLLAVELHRAGAGDFSFLRSQRGMFSLLGVNPDQVARLRDEHHVYMTADSRMNLAGVMPHNVEYLAAAIARTLRTVS